MSLYNYCVSFVVICTIFMYISQDVCMEFILRHKLLGTLYTAGKNNVSWCTIAHNACCRVWEKLFSLCYLCGGGEKGRGKGD